jgi:hypothetical protein
MSTYGPPGSGQPDDPYQRPPGTPGGPPPVDPTLPQWGPPPTGGDQPPTAPLWGQPPAGGYPPPPPPGGNPPPGGGYPPPPGGDYPPPTSGAGYPPPGPFPPAPGVPVAGQWGAPPPPGYAMPPAPPAKKRGGRIALIIILVVVLLLCPCLGLAGWAVFRAADNGGKSAAPAVSTSAAPTEEPSAAPTTAEPSPTDDGGDFAKGDCVVNDGTDANAELRKVPCGPNTYQVLLKIPATSDGDKCKTLAPSATANYVHDNSVDFLDYVLCLKKRTK